MEIKRIQLRGISRSPSDRLTEDGGCAESLNVFLDNSELSPVVEPKDLTSKLADTSDIHYDDIFVHRVSTRENYILINNSAEGRGIYVPREDGSGYDKIAIGDDRIIDITALGNTIIAAGEKETYYILFALGKYEILGTSLPKLNLIFSQRIYKKHPVLKDKYTFQVYHNKDDYASANKDWVTIDGTTYYLSKADVEGWQKAINTNAVELDFFNSQFWGKMQQEMRKVARGGLFFYPIMLRYAIKLYDGSYTQHSVPILLGGNRRFFDCSMTNYYDGMDETRILYMYASLIQAYVVDMKVHLSDSIDKWRDIIKSIDLFISEPLCYPQVNSPFSMVKEIDGTKVVSFQNIPDTSAEDDSIENILVSASNFYKIKSFSVDNLLSLLSGEELKNKEDYFMTEKLYVNERLPDGFRTNHKYLPQNLATFNEKILAFGMTEVFYSGEPQPSSIVSSSETPVADEGLVFYYKITSNGGKECVIKSRGVDGSNTILLPIIPISAENPDGTMSSLGERSSFHGGWLVYPDTRCKEVYFKNASDEYNTLIPWKKVEMKPHPLLQCSYAYLGIDKDITKLTYLPQFYGDFQEDNIGDEYSRSYLFQSSLENPFLFPASGRKKLPGNILGFAIASTPMSQGQFGQYPLYAFTDEGVWAMAVNNEGALESYTPISREICCNPKSITPLDQSVVFLTEKGLMLLKGTEIENLSPYMNGRHYSVEPSAHVIINCQDQFNYLLDTVNDSETTFLAFMKNASIGYDYAGKRIICFNENKPYQYVYMLDTKTWHKVKYAREGIKPLNSYPECLVLSKDGMLYDYSTHLDASQSQNTEKGIIATRPFDLGEPDVLKTIKDIRVRGQFPRGAVKFILLGSNDGIHFSVINTLRGKSWKLFRLIILADLDATDRISWVDIGYETRFTNKLR